MWAVIKKDFKMLFYSPIGYIVLAIFLFIFSLSVDVTAIMNNSVDFNEIYYSMARFALPIMIAVLSMKAFSEEKHKGTDKLLFSSGKSPSLIIIGKILAVSGVCFIATLISMLYCFLFLQYGTINFTRIAVTLFGFMLLSISYASFGVLISSLTENQIISASITLAYLLISSYFSFGNGVFKYLSLFPFFSRFTMGILSSTSIIVFITFSIACVLLTTLELDRKRKID